MTRPKYIDPATFRSSLIIDTATGQRMFSEVVEPWQADDFNAIDPTLRCMMGQGADDARMFHYWERGRGHSKTTDAANVGLSALVGSPRAISIGWAAGDQDQAQLGRNAINRFVDMNPMLREKVKGQRALVDVREHVVRNTLTGSVLNVLSSDGASSWGRLDDVTIIDELSVWRDNSQQLWESMFSGVAKKGGRGVLLVISNAGHGKGVSWQWRVREAARTSPRWQFSTLDGPKASWISAESLAEQRAMLPPLSFRRVWLNEWVSSTGDALTEDIIEAAFAANLSPFDRPDGHVFTAGLDMSVSRDATAFVVVGKNHSSRYRLAMASHWKPAKGEKIDQSLIEDAVLQAHKIYRFQKVAADPFQAEGLVQRLQREGVPIEVRQQQGKQLVEQAMTLVEVFNGRRIDLFNDGKLRHELSALMVEQKSYGLRLVSSRDQFGHGDLVTALCLALVVAKPLAGGPASWGGTINVGGLSQSYLGNKPAGTREKVPLGGYRYFGPDWSRTR